MLLVVSPLHDEVENADLEQLNSKSAEIDAQAPTSPHAAKLGNKEAVELLLDNHAKVADAIPPDEPIIGALEDLDEDNDEDNQQDDNNEVRENDEAPVGGAEEQKEAEVDDPIRVPMDERIEVVTCCRIDNQQHLEYLPKIGITSKEELKKEIGRIVRERYPRIREAYSVTYDDRHFGRTILDEDCLFKHLCLGLQQQSSI